MIKRKALLLNCPGDGVSYLKGVALDIKRYTEYLVSSAGGSWNYSEIQRMENICCSDLTKVLEQEKNNDILYLIFCGHGFFSKKYNSQMLCLSKDQDYVVNDILKYGKRLLIISDSCQEIIDDRGIRLEASMNFSKHKDVSDSRRQKFDAMISQIPEGSIYQLKACEKDELANENSQGGVFTQALIGTCKATVKNGNDFNLCSSFQVVSDSVKSQTGGKQKPELVYPRSIRSMSYLFALK